MVPADFPRHRRRRTVEIFATLSPRARSAAISTTSSAATADAVPRRRRRRRQGRAGGALHGAHQDADAPGRDAPSGRERPAAAPGRDRRASQRRALPRQRVADVRDALLRDARPPEPDALVLQRRPQPAVRRRCRRWAVVPVMEARGKPLGIRPTLATPPPPARSPPAIACTCSPTASPRPPTGEGRLFEERLEEACLLDGRCARRGNRRTRRSPGFASSPATRRSRTTSRRWPSGWCDEAVTTATQARWRLAGRSARAYRDW